MSIILNEYAWAERAIVEHDLGRKPSETLSRIAKYYAYCGMRKSEVRRKLEEFLYICDPHAVASKWTDTLDRLTKNAFKYGLVVIDGIDITDAEMEEIAKVHGKQAQRLAFTLLCIAKYKNEVSGSDESWVNTPDSEIMKMANIHTSVKRQCGMYAQLRDLGMIRFAKRVDNLSVKVMFARDGDVVMRVRDFRNLGYQYDMYNGGPYFVCINCGITDRLPEAKDGTRRARKYCRDCAAKIHTRQRVESVMRARKKSERNDCC